jgi:Asp-tRNA(Asn)/Glu-tRNA(Gln) amidotransferase A subunit family amidase
LGEHPIAALDRSASGSSSGAGAAIGSGLAPLAGIRS